LEKEMQAKKRKSRRRYFLTVNAYCGGETLLGPTIRAGEEIRITDRVERPLFIKWLGDNPIVQVETQDGRHTWVREIDVKSTRRRRSTGATS
jgi:hypothetical protein